MNTTEAARLAAWNASDAAKVVRDAYLAAQNAEATAWAKVRTFDARIAAWAASDAAKVARDAYLAARAAYLAKAPAPVTP